MSYYKNPSMTYYLYSSIISYFIENWIYISFKTSFSINLFFRLYSNILHKYKTIFRKQGRIDHLFVYFIVYKVLNSFFRMFFMYFKLHFVYTRSRNVFSPRFYFNKLVFLLYVHVLFTCSVMRSTESSLMGLYIEKHWSGRHGS